MLVKGDKIVAKKNVLGVIPNGDICEVLDVNEEMNSISFAFCEGMHKGVMSFSEYEEYFDKYEEPKKREDISVTSDMIRDILNNSDIEVATVFDKCTVVSCRLPNGFVIVESSACIAPEDYDEDMGVEICLSKIIDKLWELEEYRKYSLCEHIESNVNEGGLCDDCDGCPYGECCDEEDEYDACLDDDLDCDDCPNREECWAEEE